MVAFLGRYGHQPAERVLRMPITDAQKLMNAVSSLIKEENEIQSRMETDG